MLVTHDPDEDDVSSVVSVGSTPPGRSRSSTESRPRAISVSDVNYSIIRQTVEVSLVLVLLISSAVSQSHFQEQRMLEQMELMNSALALEAIAADDPHDSREWLSVPRPSTEARSSAVNQFVYCIIFHLTRTGAGGTGQHNAEGSS